MAGRRLHPLGHRQGRERQRGRGLDRDQGHGRQRRPDAESPDAQDRRPELLARQDQAGRAAGLVSRRFAGFSATAAGCAQVGICFLFARVA